MSDPGGGRKLAAMTTLELRHHLQSLGAERAAASLIGLDRDDRYLDNLQEALDAARYAYVGAVVTEIATLRAELDGPLLG
jgi:hypothetical protein